jgi:hypothetical protein
MAHPISLLFGGVSGAVGAGVDLLKSGSIGKMAFGSVAGGIYGASQGYDINSRVEGFAKGALLGAGAGAAVAAGPSLISAVSKTGYKGAKKLWSANMAAGGRAAQKRARLMEFGDSMASGPLPRDMQPGRMSAAFASPMGTAARGAGRAGMFALNNPMGILGAVGVGAGAISGINYLSKGQPMTSPGLQGAQSNLSYNQQAMMSAEVGQIGMGSLGSADTMKGQFEYSDWMANTGRHMAARSKVGRFANSTVGLNFGLHSGRHG